MSIERLSEDQIAGNPGHTYRYKLARSYINSGDTVLDVASGIGYGSQILCNRKKINYIGVDKIVNDDKYGRYGKFISNINLDKWQPDFSWDVTVSFETIEHVENFDNLVSIMKMCKSTLVLSVPTRPTKHMNPYHLHDFTVDQILDIFSDMDLVHIEDQPSELSHIFVFNKKEL